MSIGKKTENCDRSDKRRKSTAPRENAADESSNGSLAKSGIRLVLTRFKLSSGDPDPRYLRKTAVVRRGQCRLHAYKRLGNARHADRKFLV